MGDDGKQTPNEMDSPEGMQFAAYDVPPKPVGGFPAIQKNLAYPEKAREEGVEGRVVVYAKVNTAGKVIECKIAESLPVECDAAAVKAIEATNWEPALKDEAPADVWVAVPIDFKLK